MPLPRFSIPDFSVANPLYAGATITVYTIDVNGAKTTTKADLWDANVGGNALTNPQTLDSDGKFTVAVYIDEPVIVTISGLSISDHDTGIITTMGNWRGDWVTATIYYANDIVRDGANGADTKNLYHAAETHTSDVWATDLSAAEWVLAIDVEAISAGGGGGQAQDPVLDDLSALTEVSGADQFIVSTGPGAYAHESAATARGSLGLGALATKDDVNNGDWSGADLAVVNGGTGASSASAARTSLGLVIATDVLAPDGDGSALTGIGGSALVTGDIKQSLASSVPSGWLQLNANSLGDTASGATFEGAAYQDLYDFLWDNLDDAHAPVSTGRGASAAADWSAGKTITMPDARGRALVGSGTGSGLSARALGDDGIGEEDHQLIEAELAAHTHGNGTLAVASGGGHTHPTNVYNVGGGDPDFALPANDHGTQVTSASAGSHGHSMSGAIADAGSDTAHNTMQPSLAVHTFIKL